MSPRAACRLERLGYQVEDYAGGKVDWAAAGLPMEGSALADTPIGRLCRPDVPTCRPEEPVGTVAERVVASSFDTCLVVTDEGCVLGRLYRSELGAHPDTQAEEAMRPGPSTFRPDVPATEMLGYMQEHELRTAPVTTSSGALVGLLLRGDVEAAVHAMHDPAHAD